MEEHVIEFDRVVRRFDEKAVLDGLTFAVAKGETFVIVGHSGTGKSVTLRHIVGLESPDEGEVRVKKSRIGYLFQTGALLAWKTVAENVALPLEETTDLSDEEIDRKVSEALSAVGLSAAADRYPSEISGGMQKRAGLARSIVCEPEMILYDEPTSGLDPVTSRQITDLIERIGRERGVTSVVVTHDLASALRFADRILLLDGGKAVECAAPRDFIRSTNSLAREFLDAIKGELS